MSKQIIKAPELPAELEEDASWKVHDATDYLDWTKTEEVILPDLTHATVSLRLPQPLLDALKTAAHSRNMSPQSLIKIWLQEKLNDQ